MTTATPTSSAAVQRQSAADSRSWFARIPAPWFFASLITLILVIGEYNFHILGGYERLAVALGVAIGAEFALSRLLRGKWPMIISAYISGNSVCILLKPAAGVVWPFAMAALIAILSKYVLTYRGRHLWNPTNFSIGALVLLAPGTFAVLSHQWGNTEWTVALIYAVGLLVVRRARVLSLTLTYLVSFALLTFVRSGMDGTLFRTELAPLTGPMYTLFVFFMITDPRTVVSSPRLRILVVVLIAIVDNAIRYLGDKEVGFVQPFLVAPPIFALFIVGPIALWLSLYFAPTDGVPARKSPL